MLDNEGYEITFRQWRRQRRIEKRMKRMEKGEPNIWSLIFTRFIECLLVELVLSVIVSVLMVTNVIPQTTGNILLLLGMALIVFALFTVLTGNSIFWAIMNVKIYLKVSLGGYFTLVVLSVLLRIILSTSAFSWVFMPFKFFVFLGLHLEASMAICHLIMLALNLAVLINVKFDHMNELSMAEEDED